jgi:3-methylfumaryl-CoA hydratase
MTQQAPTDYSAWIGRQEQVDDPLPTTQAQAVAAMLDLDPAPYVEGAALPPLWQWFYFLPRAPQQRLSSDGHPERGDFLPPIPLPRRMFAGSRLTVHAPLRLGRPARREGEITNVALKQGKSGTLAFVTVRYRFTQAGVLCLDEEQDIVYREPGAPVPAPVPAALPALPPGAWTRTVQPDTRLLFRFSALTFNAHRIHYDRPYAMHEEGYPGLVVHGPLTAVLLAELVRRHAADRAITRFAFKGLAPLFDGAPLRLEGRADGDAVTLSVTAPDGTTAMAAEATLGVTPP